MSRLTSKAQRSCRPAESEYPCLKVSVAGRIVLFISKETGVIVGWDNPPHEVKIGAFSKDWAETEFKPFTGTVTITQE